jgi:ubiquinone/menaquinone biosynthesis C-methylase UbiE
LLDVVLLKGHPVVTALLPVGTRRRAVAGAVARRVLPAALMPPPAKRPPALVYEERELRRSWASHRPEMLDVYLVTGFQDPRVNIQSILGRHAVVRLLFGSTYDELMRGELAFAVELNAAIRDRAQQLKVSMVATMDPERRASILRVMEPFEDRASTYERLWWEAMASARPRRHLRVVELACGSANDYRALAAYGIARFVDYTGVDLNGSNIDNAKQRFPHVDFRVGSILSLPLPDRSADLVLAFDIFEHLSPSALQPALDEAVRVSRQALHIAFFRMADVPEHVIVPRGSYYYNTLSVPRIRAYLERHYPSVDVVHIRSDLRDRFGFPHYYNGNAYSVTAQRPVPGWRTVVGDVVRRKATALRT